MCSSLGYFASRYCFGPMLKLGPRSIKIHMKTALLFGFGLSMFTTKRMKPNKHFHDLVAQPNPHGSYFRKVLRYHFPALWDETSKTLYENGYNIIEMNEYDDKIDMPQISHKFDTSFY